MEKTDINLIKKLRLKTDAPIIECKKALIKSKKDFKKAQEILRAKFNIKALNLKLKNTSEGVIFAKIKDKSGVLLEINCETNLITKNIKFINFIKKLSKLILKNKILNINNIKLLKFNNKISVESKRLELMGYLNENIIIKRFKYIKTKYNLISYLHNNKIAVILEYKGDNKKIAKDIAMHIAALKPMFLSKKHISKNILKNEKNIIKKRIFKLNKPLNIKKKIINNLLNDFIKDISLLNQTFIKDTKKKVKDILKENYICIKSFNIFY